MSIRWLLAPLMLLLVGFEGMALADPRVAYQLDFTDYDEGSVEKWLASKGFAFKADADDRKKIELDVGDDGLIVEAVKKARSLLVNERANVSDYQKVRITWKVDRYPEGANYDAGVRNEAIMLFVFFGHEKISSGSFLIPDSPYFIGLFLCNSGTADKAYTGRYFQKGGRYVCVGKPKVGQAVTSEYDLIAAYKSIFGADKSPVISGIAIGTDTSDSKGGGKSRAAITSIEFLTKD